MEDQGKDALPAGAGPAAPPAPPIPQQQVLEFTGSGREYFRVWVVNLALSLLTVGIYSAWAKVRRKQYFYAHTRLNGTPFNYLANPVSILRGRLIMLPFALAYVTVSNMWPQYGLLMLAAFLPILPWVAIKALRFNAVNSEWRGLRFGFEAPFGAAAATFTLTPVLVVLTFGVAGPYYLYRLKRFITARSRYGATRFSFDGRLGKFFRYAFAALGILLVLAIAVTIGTGFVVGQIASAADGAAEETTAMLAGFAGMGGFFLIYLFAWCYFNARIASYAWANTRLGELGFRCDWGPGGLFRLYFVNALAVVASAGLLIPWAHVRTTRYKLERLAVIASDEQLAAFQAGAAAGEHAAGDAAVDLFDFDLGL